MQSRQWTMNDTYDSDTNFCGVGRWVDWHDMNNCACRESNPGHKHGRLV